MKIISTEKGMSAVEVMVSLAILGIIAVGMMGFFTDSFKFQSRSQKTVAMQKMAEDILEQLRSTGKAEIGSEVVGLTDYSEEIGEYIYTIDVEQEKISEELSLYNVNLTIKTSDEIEVNLNSKFRFSEVIRENQEDN